MRTLTAKRKKMPNNFMSKMRRFWPRLTSSTSQLNFCSYLLACMLTISLFVFINGVQSFTLNILYQVNRSQLGNISGSLVFWDQLLSLALLGSWGVVSDKIGRRAVFSIGFILMGVGICLSPFGQAIYPDLLVFRLIFAVGAAACGGMVTAVLADYVDERDKGAVSGLVGLMSGLGALLGALVLAKMPAYLNDHSVTLADSLRYSYLLTGSISIACGLVMTFALKPPARPTLAKALVRKLFRLDLSSLSAERNGDISNTRSAQASRCPYGYDEHDDAAADINENSDNDDVDDENTPINLSRSESPAKTPRSRKQSEMEFSAECPDTIVTGRCTMPGVLEQQPQFDSDKGFWALVWEGLKLIANPYIFLAYLGGFVARGDSIIITLFLPLWINNYYIDHGLCPDGGMDSNNGGPFSGDPELHRCADAVRKAFSYSGIAQSFALLGAPLFGYLAHRLRRRRSVSFIIASFISFVGYTSLFFIKDPVKDAAAIYPLLCIIGLGEIGMIVTSLSLVTSDVYVKPSIRGSVAGCYSLFGGLGLLILTKIGGLLTQVWTDPAPFFVVGILAGCTCFIGFGIELFPKRRILLPESLNENTTQSA